MNRLLTLAAMTASSVLVGCRDNSEVTGVQNRLKWGWDKPHATGMGGPPTLVCDQYTVAFNASVTCTLANSSPLMSPVWTFWGPVTRTDPGDFQPFWGGPMVIS